MALGKGLNSLIGDKKAITVPNSQSGKQSARTQNNSEIATSGERIYELPIEEIHPNRSQPRHYFDPKELDDLVVSIKKHGILQPIVVTKDDDGGGYELIAGERRTRASKLAQKKTIPAIIRSASNQERLELALIENIQRHNLNPVEEARAYQQLIADFDLTQQEVAAQVGKSRSAVANAVRLLDLPEVILIALESGELSAGKARALLSLPTEQEQVVMFESMIGKNISVRDVEQAVSNKKNKKYTTRTTQKDPNITAIEKKLEGSLGTKVRVDESNGSGAIHIEFYSVEELQSLIEKFEE